MKVHLVSTQHIDLRMPPDSIDGVPLVARMRILLVAQHESKQNGPYALLWGKLRRLRGKAVFASMGVYWGRTRWRRLAATQWFPYVERGKSRMLGTLTR